MSRCARQLFLAVFFAFSIAANAEAYTFSISLFKIDRNGTPFFEDEFGDGVPPPDRAGAIGSSTASYFVTGAVGPENVGGNDKLLLNQSGAVPGLGLFGNSPQVNQRVRLITDTDDTNTTLGLKRNMTFLAAAAFDLIEPAVGENYGIRLGDNASGPAGNGSDIVDLRVRNASGTPVVQFRRTDLTAGAQIEYQLPLELGHEQIFVSLDHPSANTDAIFARYAYVDNGALGPVQSFTQTFDIFHGEMWTQASFNATALLVPEPKQYAMMLAGLAFLGCVAAGRKFVS